MTVESFHKMFTERLNELYNTQRQVAEAYPRLAEAACSYKISDMLQERAVGARDAAQQLDGIYAVLAEDPSRGKSARARELVREAYKRVEEEMDLEVVDAVLMDIAQRMQAHVAQCNRNVSELAQVMGNKAIPETLRPMLEREEASVEQIEHVAERCALRHALAV